jgi:hypothetical protein
MYSGANPARVGEDCRSSSKRLRDSGTRTHTGGYTRIAHRAHPRPDTSPSRTARAFGKLSVAAAGTSRRPRTDVELPLPTSATAGGGKGDLSQGFSSAEGVRRLAGHGGILRSDGSGQQRTCGARVTTRCRGPTELNQIPSRHIDITFRSPPASAARLSVMHVFGVGDIGCLSHVIENTPTAGVKDSCRIGQGAPRRLAPWGTETHAATSYSWMSPPSRSRLRTGVVLGSLLEHGGAPAGGRSSRARCGLPSL